ncbi:unnamed protein product [Callosobruchus maculatus]|uniref:FAM86 N-terminal domain-containing protein n=1 Tax=Callosobruchus maculatus TaxID=64391 RepID=A0A653CN01_CALMS|nr:unnamed protein product [Callosobruchus maculatus]
MNKSPLADKIGFIAKQFLCNVPVNSIKWKAALALSEWIVSNQDLWKDKKVLELGSGLGLTGLVLSTECIPNAVYLTDCHPSVLKNMYDNVRLNTERESAESRDETDGTMKLTERCIYHSSGRKPEIAIFNLPWEDVVEETCKQIGEIDIIIAADIVYDEDLFADLLEAMRNFSRYCDVKEFIFACTERNPGTLGKFIKDSEKGFFAEALQTPQQKYFIWPEEPPVKLFRLTPK